MTAESLPTSTELSSFQVEALGDEQIDEAARLTVLHRYSLAGLPSSTTFDRVASLAARWLRSPMATVSIVDSERTWFLGTHGVESMPLLGLEPGLCVSALRQDRPRVVPDTRKDALASNHPWVRDAPEVRFYAAAPIVTEDGHRLGTVNVLDVHPRDATVEELRVLQDLAAIVRDALELRHSALQDLENERALRKHRERDQAAVEEFASTLQRTLVPPVLPRVPGLETACYYYAASPEEVTGDFYDVFALDHTQWAFFLGDVSGHGAPAATVTSLTRYTLRAAALHNPDPAAALAELNAALLMEPQIRQCCTVLFGVLQPAASGGFDIVLAGGGHPPAMHLRPEHVSDPVQKIWPPGGMLVGALADATFATTRLHLQAGHTLLLYTDGLIEARPEETFFGEEGLVRSLAQHAHGSAHEVVSELTTLITSFVPAPTDDVALLALSVPTPHAEHTESAKLQRQNPATPELSAPEPSAPEFSRHQIHE